MTLNTDSMCYCEKHAIYWVPGPATCPMCDLLAKAAKVAKPKAAPKPKKN